MKYNSLTNEMSAHIYGSCSFNVRYIYNDSSSMYRKFLSLHSSL